jgi:hypothetical protein
MSFEVHYCPGCIYPKGTHLEVCEHHFVKKIDEEPYKVFVAVEYNYKTVGGVFNTEEACTKWCERAMDLEPNLMWDCQPFTLNEGITEAEILESYMQKY